MGEIEESTVASCFCLQNFVAILLMKCRQLRPTIGLNILARNLAVLYITLPMLETIGGSGASFLWILGKP